MQHKIEIKLSSDGSSTLYRPDLDEHYHSINGAIQESMHVFISTGLKQLAVSPLHVLEVGFGTGLNALLTFVHKQEGIVFYHALEKYPLTKQITDSVNYPNLITEKNTEEVFFAMHQADWDCENAISDDFYLTKLKMDLLDFNASEIYDLVYFDAFAPEKQPDLWTEDVFIMLYRAMKMGAVLTTYCAKGVVRRAMQSAGFVVERLPGPPGKREILRAVKNS
jgi:tRNA U34 5-methylaminomethyl-2-thiouridine-forming methyltransferase MnmC